MKRTVSAIPLMLMILYSLLPLCFVAAQVLGYNFLLYNYPVYIAVLAFFSLAAAVYIIVAKNYPEHGYVLSAFLVPLTVLNAILIGKHCELVYVLLFMVVSIGSFAVLLYKSRSVAKILSVAATVVLLILFFALDYFRSVFVGFNNDEVVKSISSPDNRYTAEVISSNQGALGGNTYVDIRFDSENINILIGEYRKPAERIYSGKYGEYENIQVSWKDNDTLLINGEAYNIHD